MPALILDGQNVDTTLEEFDTAIDGHTSAIDDAVAAIANNTSAINNNTTSIESLPASGSYIYVDASAGAGDGSGTFIDPYRSLKNAMDEEVTDAETDDMVFHVAPGIYDGTFSLTKTTANQSVSIIGSGSENTIIRGAATWSNSTSHAFQELQVDLHFEHHRLTLPIWRLRPILRRCCVTQCPLQDVWVRRRREYVQVLKLPSHTGKLLGREPNQ